MFRNYSKQACLFECQLRHAADSAGRIPWDHPVPIGYDHMGMCRSLHSVDDGQVKNLLADFEAAMADTEALEKCHCPPDCEQTAYKVQVNTLKQARKETIK